MRNITRFIFSIGLVAAITLLSALSAYAEEKKEPAPVEAQDSSKLLAEREELDSTVWADEVEAQVYETVFIRLWDRIRAGDNAEKFAALSDFPLEQELRLPSAGSEETLDMGITLTPFQEEPLRTFTPAEWKTFTRAFQDAGIEIIQTEWHHSRFIPATTTNAPQSTISFSLHAIREATRTTFALKGNLIIQWAQADDEGVGEEGVATSISVRDLTLQQRSDGGLFSELISLQAGPNDFASAYPVLAYDLDSDGRTEIILPRWNSVWWNRGGREFEKKPFIDHPIDIWEAGILSDFNGDGNADFITVGKDGKPYFYAGTEQGTFPTEPAACADVHFDMPTAITAGDVDADGDLDLWMTQYKLSFTDGQMPTPYYDANDGPPSYFLINDGTGSFTDATDSAGLSPLKNRRTYSASFIDLDQDGDLDLMNVSDYAGLDIYRNNGKGEFKLDTGSFVDNRHFFGMGHTFGDYNNDGLLDFYVIGMSSTTARRLDRLNLGRADRPDVHPMRAAMGYGNRLYLGTKDGGFREDPEVAAAVARTGWSWGSTSFDFDLDGDQDIYVANGHRSGKSCQDYCTTFWRHDIYTGTSKEDLEVLKVFQTTLSELNRDELSWNGYEKNVLLVNDSARQELFLSSAFMFGSAFSFDARSVISDDFDGDGRPDLLVAKSTWEGRGFALQVHVFANDVKTDEKQKWFSVRLRESPGPGFSPNGAKVSITDDKGKIQTRWIVTGDSFLAQHAPIAHFGLGNANHVTTIEITWPNGQIERHDNLALVNAAVIARGNDPTEADSKKKVPVTFKPAVPEIPELGWHDVRAFNIPLNNPTHVPPAKAEFMRADDTVLGVILGGEARAYPWEVMANYHACNDYLDGQPIIVNMCEACNGCAAFLATVPGSVLDIRPRGLKNGTWYGIDFQTGSLWYPFIGEAFEGPLKGTKLERIRAYFSSWEDWVREHPSTTVVVNTDEMRMRPHGRASKMAACETFDARFLSRITDSKPNPNRDLLPGWTLVFGLIPEGDEKPQAFTLDTLGHAKSLVQSSISGTPILLMLQNEYQIGAYKRVLNGTELTFQITSEDPLVMTDQRGNQWTMWGRTIEGPDHPSELALVDGYMAKWYEWIENFPETELIEAE